MTFENTEKLNKCDAESTDDYVSKCCFYVSRELFNVMLSWMYACKL